MPVSEKLTVDCPEMKKVGITYENQPYLLQLDVTKSLDVIIQDICNNYRISNSSDYALQFNSPSSSNFITETNRSEIQNGTIMKLTLSPSKTADAVIAALISSDEHRKVLMLQQLVTLSLDETFARQFQIKQGYGFVADAIQDPSSSGDVLSYLLKSFVQLMDHGIASWDFLCQKFIKKVASYINPTKAVDIVTLQSVLEILEAIILHCPEKASIIDHEISLTNVLAHLQNTNSVVQKNTLGLINAFFLRGDNKKKKAIIEQIQSKSVRNVICNSILNKGPQEALTDDMKHQIYLLQSNMFNLLDITQNLPVDINDATVLACIQDLRQLAFDMDADTQVPVGVKRASNSKDFKKLGFQNTTNPLEDFQHTSTGILPLNNMIYFARNHRENYTKVVLENSRRDDGHDLPFAYASIELTRLIADILKISEPPVDDCVTFHPMFFTQEYSFEEFFCTCIQLLNKTWKEMKAMKADFVKVFGVVQEQIVRALDTLPTSFDQFRNKLSKLPYQEIVLIWKKERKMKDEGDQQAKPIIELRELIRPEIVELIKEQRLKFIIDGSRFVTKGSKRQDKPVSLYMRLSQNHHNLHYGEYDELNVPSVEQLPNKMPFDEIKDIYYGKDCPHVRDIKKKISSNLALTIQPLESAANERNEPLNLFAPNELTLNMWMDGFSILFGKEMSSEDFMQDVSKLLDVEMKLRLLDIEGIDIPNTPPPIPGDPPNFNFV